MVRAVGRRGHAVFSRRPTVDQRNGLSRLHILWGGSRLRGAALKEDGRRPSYVEAISVGLRTWGRLFSARFFAGIWIMFGLILLVVPGIVLMVRYAFLDAVVVLEGAGGDRARRQSSEITRGFRWQIFLAGLLFFVTIVPLSFAIRVPYEQLFPAAPIPWANGRGRRLRAGRGVCDIVQIVNFLYYWQATEPAVILPEPGLTAPEAQARASSSQGTLRVEIAQIRIMNHPRGPPSLAPRRRGPEGHVCDVRPRTSTRFARTSAAAQSRR